MRADRRRSIVGRCGAALALAFIVATAGHAAPVAVRLPEGNTRGFVVLRSPEGEVLAHGEMRQRPVRGGIESRLSLAFKDGSKREEAVVFSQDKTFRLERFHLVERGPSFPTNEVSFDRKSGQYKARTQEKKGGEERTSAGPLEMPPDLYNGMALVLLKNLADGQRANAQIAVFTPKPRLIKMQLVPEADDAVRFGPSTLTVRRYLVKLDVGGLAGLIAPVIGKDPPDSRYWMATGDVPAFVRFEGAMFLNGPVWRIEMTIPEWPR
jgi:hypothetical protein